MAKESRGTVALVLIAMLLSLLHYSLAKFIDPNLHDVSNNVTSFSRTKKSTWHQPGSQSPPTDDFNTGTGEEALRDGIVEPPLNHVLERRYWGDEMSACIELYCWKLFDGRNVTDEYVKCLIDHCPEAIVRVVYQALTVPLLRNDDDDY